MDPISTSDEDNFVIADINTRVCMSHEVATSFLKAFEVNVDKFNKVADSITKLEVDNE